MPIQTSTWLVGFVLISLSSSAHAGSVENTCVQNQLSELGFYAGAVTGMMDGPTKAAANDYVAFKSAESPGWAMAGLTSAEAGNWCKQLAAAYPARLSKFLKASLGGGGLVTISRLSVEGTPTTTKPYVVSLQFKAEGDVALQSACFTWNHQSEVCIPLPAGAVKSPIRAGLTTGRAGTYQLNGYVKYQSGGKKITSAQTSAALTVK